MSNNYFREVVRNWTNPSDCPITVYYGNSLQWELGTDAQLIAEETLNAIQSLAKQHQDQIA